MPQPMNGVLVLLASPGDAATERAALSAALNDWNINRGRRESVALLPWLWERHSVARVGDRPQSLINAQAVDKSDVLVAFFDSRLGSRTGVDVSGTAEEISRALEQGKHVHVYFSDEPLPRDVDAGQLEALRDFQSQLEGQGLLGHYSDPADLVGQVIRAIEADIDDSAWAAGVTRPTGPSGAQLRWRHVCEREQQGLDKFGKMKYRTIRNSLLVTNGSEDVDAEEMAFEVSGLEGAEFHFDEPQQPVTVHAGSSLAWTLIPLNSRGSSIAISATWKEGHFDRSRRWTILLEG